MLFFERASVTLALASWGFFFFFLVSAAFLGFAAVALAARAVALAGRVVAVALAARVAVALAGRVAVALAGRVAVALAGLVAVALAGLGAVALVPCGGGGLCVGTKEANSKRACTRRTTRAGGGEGNDSTALYRVDNAFGFSADQTTTPRARLLDLLLHFICVTVPCSSVSLSLSLFVALGLSVSLTHSLTHLLTHTLTHSLTHSLTHTLSLSFSLFVVCALVIKLGEDGASVHAGADCQHSGHCDAALGQVRWF